MIRSFRVGLTMLREILMPSNPRRSSTTVIHDGQLEG
jgi:hypothetical protein